MYLNNNNNYQQKAKQKYNNRYNLVEMRIWIRGSEKFVLSNVINIILSIESSFFLLLALKCP